MPRKRRKLTGHETSLVDYMKEFKENLWCDGCVKMVDVVDRNNEPTLVLACGHNTTRESSINLKEGYDLHMELGWPNPKGGWFKMSLPHWPLPSEMQYKVKYNPELIDKIRKHLNVPEWEP